MLLSGKIPYVYSTTPGITDTSKESLSRVVVPVFQGLTLLKLLILA